MKELRFNKNYKKLFNQCKARLIDSKLVTLDQLNKDFIKYDTDCEEGGSFLFTEDLYLCLFFVGDKGIPFTTLRKFNEYNFRYYCDSEDTLFNVIIENRNV